MKRQKLICKVEKIVLEEVRKEISQYCGDEFSIGPVLVKDDYQAFREVDVNDPKYILITVVYEGDLDQMPLRFENEVFRGIWNKMGETGIDAYPFIDFVKKSRWQSDDWREPRGWEW